jgi:hypothetical protein
MAIDACELLLLLLLLLPACIRVHRTAPAR